MHKILKIAQDYEDKLKKNKEAGRQMSLYVGILRGLSIIHQVAHWTSKSNEYYADHLLFDRLYNETSEHIDTAAEKLIGVFGKDNMELSSHLEFTYKFVNDIVSSTKGENDHSLAERSLLAEKAFLEFSKNVYIWLESRNLLTLGVDDMIMSIASDHESFVYLLQQRLEDN